MSWFGCFPGRLSENLILASTYLKCWHTWDQPGRWYWGWTDLTWWLRFGLVIKIWPGDIQLGSSRHTWNCAGRPISLAPFQGGWSLIILSGKVSIIRVSCFTLCLVLPCVLFNLVSCFTLFERILPSSSSKFSTSGRVRNQKGLWIIHKLNWESQLKIIFHGRILMLNKNSKK